MGFRGEALASIGSVSHARILSRQTGDELAHEIENKGGTITQVQTAAGNIGTVIEVRNLFFNTPARRRFLKGPGTEFGHINETFTRLAVPNPNIAMRLVNNGKTVADWPASKDRDRWLEAWPVEFSETFLSLDVRDAEISLRGVIGLPETARPTARYQQFFLNGRPIRDKFMQHALKEAYRGLIEPGRQPAGILLVTMPTKDVDVNVHPTKSEVRFRDSSRIHGFILSNVREKLLGSDLAPVAVARWGESKPGESSFGEPTNADPFRQSMRDKLADFFKSALPENSPPSPTFQVPAPSSPALPASNEPLSASSKNSTSPTESSRLAPVLPIVPAIQLHNSYLVVESDDGMLIIDQHALHERIMYEDLLNRIGRGPLESQRLLIPPTVAASSRQQELLQQITPLLAKLGIEAAPIGPDSVAIHSFPSFLHRLDPVEFLSELLERGEQEMLDLNQEELLHEIMDMMACKAAVKAGDPLTPAEIESLLARRHLIDRASNCPHGRPTTLRLTLRDLEKQFKRTGF
jgi:DNA mismatch repair protein MutL